MTDPRIPLPVPPRVSLAQLSVPERVEDWLAGLSDLTWLHIAGQDDSRLRIVSVLLHGNEPSSIRALHAYLREGTPPATDLYVLVGAVRAALGPPPFGQRFLPEDGDLNRCWLPPYETPRARRAEALMQRFAEARPEAILDLHNNTGHNPPYGVGPDASERVLDIASLFGSLFVHSPLRMGTLMEAAAPLMTSLTIECGRAGDPAADAIALKGLREFLRLPDLDVLRGRGNNVRVLGDPIRVRVVAGTRLAFAHGEQPDADLTLDPEIDRHNFALLPAGEALGWLRQGVAMPLRAEGADGRDRTAELFCVEDGRLYAATPWMPVMMTTSPAAVMADCLFYAVHPRR